MEFLVQKYYRRIPNKDKRVFACTFFVSLLTHLFFMVNFIPNHDSFYFFYEDQDIVTSGRWFLTYAAGISSYFHLQWVNGLLAIVYISVTAVLIVKMLEIDNVFLGCLVGVVIGVYPSIMYTFTYMFAADAYCLAMLMATAAAYLIVGDNWKKRLIGGAILGFAIGIYQAYLSFAMLLIILWLVSQALFHKKNIWGNALWALGSGIFGGVFMLPVYISDWMERNCLLIRVSGKQVSSIQWHGI